MLFLILYIIGHFTADYGLQTEYMALGKNKWSPLNGTPWYWPMIAHCSIHAGFVFAVTTLFVLVFANIPMIVVLNIATIFALFEFLLHFGIDCLKCKKLINYNIDQFLHISCKVLYYVLCLILLMII